MRLGWPPSKYDERGARNSSRRYSRRPPPIAIYPFERKSLIILPHNERQLAARLCRLRERAHVIVARD